MALELTPTEEIEQLGIHLPLLINPATVLTPKQESWGENNDHRLYHSDDPRIKTYGLEPGELDEKRAPRLAGVQFVSAYTHNKKHWFYPDGTVLPENEHQSFALALLLSANCLTEGVLDFGGRKPRIVRLNDDIRNRLQTPGVLHQEYGKRWAIGWTFGKYIFRHGLPHIMDSDTVDLFRSEQAMHPAMRLRLGFMIISEAAKIVMDPIEPFYQKARNEGRINPELPKTALRFMMQHFDQRQPEYFANIETMVA